MKQLLIVFSLSILICDSIYSMPAYPNKIPVLINGEIIYIRLFGDEHHKRAESEEGYTIIQNDKQQWCYAQINHSNQLEASKWILGESHQAEKEFSSFIKNTPLHLKSTKAEARTAKQTKQVRQLKAAIGERRVLIILMEYKDLKFTKTQNDFFRLFNEEQYNEDQAQGSVRDFYLAASYHQLELISHVYGPYTASKEMSYYGKNLSTENGNDSNPYALFEEAIQHVAEETDLSQYDGDGDGFIDNVHIIFAGYGEEAGASSNAIWSHEATFYRPYPIQGLKIDRYSCAPELRGNKGGGISRIGPHCHEIGHALGAMDYYDTDYATNGEFSGTGKWDVMASGSWNNEGITPADFNPYVKAYNYGWVSPKSLPVGNVTISPSNFNSDSYYMLKSSEKGDYYLLENRCRTGLDSGLPGEGLLIYHIHAGLEDAANEINSSAPQKCYIVCASSKYPIPNNEPISYGDTNSDGCPFPGSSNKQVFGAKTTPSAFYWSGEDCKIELNNILLADNGDIQLINESEDAGYVPPEMESLFYDGFENDLNIKILDSRSRQWAVVENPENNTLLLDRPISHSGINSLQLSARDQFYNETNAIEFECFRNNSEGRVVVKGYFTSYGLRPRLKNTLKVGYQRADSDEWTFTEFESSVLQRWQQFSINVPPNCATKFRIEGIATIGSIIAIDDIEVEQEVVNKETSIKVHGDKWGASLRSTYYSLNGIPLRGPGKGLFLKTEEGKCQKVIIK